MSAYKDMKAPVQFYYGNAAIDLDHMLPHEDEVLSPQASSSFPPLEALSSVENLMDQLEVSHKQLSFFLRDLNRIFK